ncbi:MAG: hypothetical protein ACHP8A_15065 [Terriglobales bacterium]|jgi:hypothetical protein|nr:hypothetical protein [Terriglobales bacterium]
MAPIGICDAWPDANEKMMATANISGNHKGITLEAFAETHALPPRWLALRKSCEEIVRLPGFWYRADLQRNAMELAVAASNILHSVRQAASRPKASF